MTSAAQRNQQTRIRRLTGAIAALAITLTPLAAQAHPGGWGGGWGRHRDRGPDAGDVIAGLLVLGGIAAVATAIANKNRNEDARSAPPPNYPQDRPTWKEPSWEDQDPRWSAVPPPSSASANGWEPGVHDRALDDAVEACASRARDRGGLDQIWDAARAQDGYRVRGNLGTGNPFICNVDRSGRVTDLAVLPQDGLGTSGPGAYGQSRDGGQTPARLAQVPDENDGY
jgi:hypothetical protein